MIASTPKAAARKKMAGMPNFQPRKPESPAPTMLPAWFQAWLRPFCALKPFCRTTPSVMPVTAGPIAAPAMAVATWLTPTTMPVCDQRIRKDARTCRCRYDTTQRFLSVWSMNAPAVRSSPCPPRRPAS